MNKTLASVFFLLCLIITGRNNVYAQAPGCPDIDIGPDQNLNCANNCTTLSATLLQTGLTTDYAVSSIPYAPPAPFTGGTQILISIDDVWGPVINLPFNFCFYGNMYSQIVVGANGLISFDAALANQWCEWSFTASIPTPGPPPGGLYNNSIMGAYHDLDPSYGGDINYFIMGNAPCRMFVINYYDVPHFECNCFLFNDCKRSTQQIVIYETTNVIEVYIQQKETCITWNDGNAVIGIQNANGSAGVAAPGRNTGPWSASNEAWRFTPSGSANYSVTWYDQGNNQVGTGITLNVCPPDTTTYFAEGIYQHCDGSQVIVRDTVIVNVTGGFSVSLSQTEATCGASDGTATVFASGGAGPYTYAWSPVGGSGTTANNLPAGTYSVLVTDSNGCTQTDSITVTNIGGPSVNITSFTNVSCSGGNDGTAAVAATGGSPPYSYLWNNGQTTSSATGLIAGNYAVIVTDSGGCISAASISITEPGALMPNTVVTNISCNSACDGDIDLTVTSGTPPYNYVWAPGGEASQDIINLCAGVYCVTVTDFNLCDTVICILITDPSPITLALSSTPSACGGSDGTATVAASGGTGAYTYTWSPVGGNGAFANNLPAGIYTVLVTDANGCSQSDSVTVINTGGAALSITDSSMVSCKGGNDGSATLTASGGTLPYTYSWNTSPVQTGSTATGLTAGYYNVTVIDASGCISTTSTTISEPDSIIVTVTGDTTICFGDSATIGASASGGILPYTFIWDNGLGNDSIHAVAPSLTTTYTVIVQDNNGCTGAAQSITVSTNIPLSLTASGAATICSGDTAMLTAVAAGGDGGPYTYSWSNGAGTNDTVIVSPPVTTTYIVTVSDACGSPSTTDSVNITVNSELVLITTPANICPGESAVLNVSGALTYWWAEENSPLDTIATGPTITVSPAITTTYLVTGFDGVCEKTAPVSVFVNPPPVADFEFVPDSASILNPLIIFINTSSATDFSFWDFGDGTSFSGIDASHAYADTGTYPVWLFVNDSFGCRDSVLQYVTIVGEFILFVPNAFTPGSANDINDIFIPKGIGIDVNNFEMYIYDRWGNEIFKTTDFSKGWDGRANNGRKIAQQDVYVWLVLTRDVHRKRHRYIGHVTLIR